jgi:hypothetical protein
MWFFNQKRADQIAQSISQLIHTLSDGRKNHGPTSPERLLREFATLLSEDTIIGQRVVKLLMARPPKQNSWSVWQPRRIIPATG